VTISALTSVPVATISATETGSNDPSTPPNQVVSVTVPTVDGIVPTGTVTIYDNGAPVGTGTLGPNGTVVVTIPGGSLPVGTSTITVGYSGDGHYGSSTSAPQTVSVTPPVTTESSIPTATINPTAPVAGQPVTVTVTVPTVGSTPPTGTVTIYDNGTPVVTGTLGPNGTVVVNIPAGSLPPDTSTITIGYGGDGHYSSSTSIPMPITVTAAPVLDFTLTLTSAPSQTVISGGAATIAVQVAPTSGSYPGVVTLTATGLPAGATATFTPATIAANGGPTPVNLSVQTQSLVNMGRTGSEVSSIAMGLLLLPLAGARRLRRSGRAAGRYLFLAVVLLAGVAATAGLTGCGSGNGFFGHAPATYNVTITATSGTIQHSVNATLNVQ
jgi:hypothetical protein